jgi:hypothetical protein
MDLKQDFSLKSNPAKGQQLKAKVCLKYFGYWLFAFGFQFRLKETSF